MRKFELIEQDGWNSVTVLVGILEISPNALIGHGDIMKRVRIAEMLNEAKKTGKSHCVLEGDDWDYLIKVLEGPCSQVAKRPVLNILDAVKAAEYVPVPSEPAQKRPKQ